MRRCRGSRRAFVRGRGGALWLGIGGSGRCRAPSGRGVRRRVRIVVGVRYQGGGGLTPAMKRPNAPPRAKPMPPAMTALIAHDSIPA